MAAIFLVSAQSTPPVSADFPNPAGHVMAYAGLGVLVMRAVTGGLPARVTARAAVTTIAIALAYGVSDEIHQAFVPGRTPDVLDVAADGIGALLATGACWAWGILSAPRPRVPNPRPR